MNLDALIHHYLDGADPETADPMLVDDAVERIGIDFGVEQDSGRRFALWSLLLMLGRAPAPDDAFETQAEREAARRFAALMHAGTNIDETG